MAVDSPLSNAQAKNVLFMAALSGRPKETFDTPKEVWQPRRFFMMSSARSVSMAAPGSALTVIAKVSKIISFLSIPYSAALFRIFSAMATLPSAVLGIPSSSRVRATTAPPYFLTRGKICYMEDSLPLTEFIIALPLYNLRACSIASVSAVSI